MRLDKTKRICYNIYIHKLDMGAAGGFGRWRLGWFFGWFVYGNFLAPQAHGFNRGLGAKAV